MKITRSAEEHLKPADLLGCEDVLLQADMEIEVGSLRRSHSCPAKQTIGPGWSGLDWGGWQMVPLISRLVGPMSENELFVNLKW